jgi:chromosomal replication initiation ATPase DnaA
MAQIKREAYPVIFKIINDAEFELCQLIGSKVTLKIEVGERAITQIEANKMRLQQLICEEFSVTWRDMITGPRNRKLTDARKVYCYMATHFLHQTCAETGKDLNRDYTTVIHLRNACTGLIEIKDGLVDNIENIKKALYENIH